MISRRWPLAATCLVITLLASCGQPDDQNDTPASPSTHGPVGASGANAYVALQNARSLAGALATVEARDVEKCMRADGFDYRTPALEPVDEPWTPAQASHGYGRWIDDVGAQPELSASELHSYLGPQDRTIAVRIGQTRLTVRTGGCLGMVKTQLYGNLRAYTVGHELAANLPFYAGSDPAGRPAWQAVDERWAACMADSGHRRNRPEDALVYWQNHRPVAGRADAAEVSEARVDQRCRSSVGLDQARRQITAAWEAGAVRSFEHDVVMYDRILQEAVRRVHHDVT